jgi:hypothetical protein
MIAFALLPNMSSPKFELLLLKSKNQKINFEALFYNEKSKSWLTFCKEIYVNRPLLFYVAI